LSREVSIIGLGLTVAGVAIAIWARFYIGRNWSATVTIKRDHQLIRTGPYSLARHPIYSGFALAALGTALARGEVGGLLGFALVLLSFQMKARLEEVFMTEQFGAEYTQYKREVKGLIPFIL
jgi:protein-S-isoprenylcysteine O-methyltransferase Ste14